MDRKEYLKSNPVDRLSSVRKITLVNNLKMQNELLQALLDNPEYESEDWFRSLVQRLKMISKYIPKEVR